jgi:hypothetical protein
MISAAAINAVPFLHDQATDAREPSQWVRVLDLFNDSPWLPDAAHRIAQFGALPPNWDGSNSPTIAPNVITTAIEILQRLAPARAMSLASPVPGGGVQLEWHLADRYLEIEVLPDKSLMYLVEPQGREAVSGTFSLGDAATVGLLAKHLAHR